MYEFSHLKIEVVCFIFVHGQFAQDSEAERHHVYEQLVSGMQAPAKRRKYVEADQRIRLAEFSFHLQFAIYRLLQKRRRELWSRESRRVPARNFAQFSDGLIIYCAICRVLSCS